MCRKRRHGAVRQELLAALGELRQSITAEATARTARWRAQIELELFVPSAENLAHYLALRHHDLAELQCEARCGTASRREAGWRAG